MRKRTKGHFQNVLLRWPQEEHPLIPPFAAPVHAHTCMHTHTHTHTPTHTHRLHPSIHPGVWDSVTGEAGWWLRWRSWVHWTLGRGCGGPPRDAVWAESTVLSLAREGLRVPLGEVASGMRLSHGRKAPACSVSGHSLLTDQPWLCGSRWIPVKSGQVSRSLGQRRPGGWARIFI